MKNAPKISVIVPIYKVERYIGRCLLSLLRQSFKDFEVLMINDGSPDNSRRIAQAFSRRDKRFILFDKENGGLSDARNYGIERARGEYIACVDSDDFVHKDYLKTLYGLCKKYDADMSYCNFMYSFFNGSMKIRHIASLKNCAMEKKYALDQMIRDITFQSYAWNKMYKASLFKDNDIRYPHMYFEDVATSSRLMYNANRLAVCTKKLYYYEKRIGSIMGTMDSQKIYDLYRSVLVLRNYLQKKGAYDEYKKAVKALARKYRLVNIYSISRQHIINFDFKNLKKNFDINRYIMEYIISDDFEPVDGLPEIPIKFYQPGEKKKSKK